MCGLRSRFDGEAATGDFEVHARQVPQDVALAGFPLALDELEEEDAHAVARGAHGQADGGGGLAFAVAGEDQRKAVAARAAGGSGHGLSNRKVACAELAGERGGAAGSGRGRPRCRTGHCPPRSRAVAAPRRGRRLNASPSAATAARWRDHRRSPRRRWPGVAGARGMM